MPVSPKGEEIAAAGNSNGDQDKPEACGALVQRYSGAVQGRTAQRTSDNGNPGDQGAGF